MEHRYLYAGNCYEHLWQYENGYVGLADRPVTDKDMKHDLRNPLPFDDGTVDRFQSEDVSEHISLSQQHALFCEIHRVLRPGGLFRFSVPDYRCDVLRQRSVYNAAGDIVFDPDGGGMLGGNLRVLDGGHVWFPVFETVEKLFLESPFELEKIKFLHYYDASGAAICKPIDYSLGMVQRTPDYDERVSNPYRPMSIVVDAIK